jgi:membrane protease YdiL (CAAX protease family)
MDAGTRNFLLLKLAETLGVIAVIMIAGTSQRLTYKPVQFKYPQRESRASISVYIAALVIAVLLFLTPLKEKIPAAGGQLLLTAQLLAALLSLGAGAFALFTRRQPLLSAGWGAKPNLKLGLRIGIMLVFLTIFLRGKVMTIVNGVTAAEGIAFALILLTCLAEETLFRGYLQLRMTSWLGKPAGWLAASGMFVLWSLPRLIAWPADLWLNLLVLIAQSLLLGWLMHKTGHVLAPALYRAVSEWLTILQ